MRQAFCVLVASLALLVQLCKNLLEYRRLPLKLQLPLVCHTPTSYDNVRVIGVTNILKNETNILSKPLLWS